MVKKVAQFHTLVYGYFTYTNRRSTLEKRLTKEDWIINGLSRLSKHGIKSLKAGAMATELNVSRGSFYWHFKSAADFEIQLMEAWKHRNTEAIIIELNNNASPEKRLIELVKLTISNNLHLDKAMRSWSIVDTRANQIVAEVDSQRVAYVESLLKAISKIDKQELSLRAKLLYWACIGRSIVEADSEPDYDLSDIKQLIGIFTN